VALCVFAVALLVAVADGFPERSVGLQTAVIAVIGAAAWPVALVLMALLEVSTRIAIVQLRGRRAMHSTATTIAAAA